MKKILLLSTAVFLLSACSGYNVKLEMPDEFVQKEKQYIEEAQALLKENPDDLSALHALGYHFQQLGEYDNAIEAYEKVLAKDERHFPALNNLADIYEQVEEYQLAAKYIKTLYENNTADVEVIRDTVRILLKAGEEDNALAALNNFVDVHRENTTPEIRSLSSDLYDSIKTYQSKNEK